MVFSRCDIPPGPGQQIVWRRGTEVLSAGSTLLKPDPRYSVTSPGSLLTIKRLVREDGGELVCQVQTELGSGFSHRHGLRHGDWTVPLVPGGQDERECQLC